MATNATTWFYAEPEHSAYLLEERVNHTFWAHRIADVYFDCVSAEPPFKMVGVWRGQPLTIEWVPQDYFTLTTTPGPNTDQLLVGIQEILGFLPAVSYIQPDGQQVTHWYFANVHERLQAIQGNPNYQSIRRYTK
jgi:hypothetical protein